MAEDFAYVAEFCGRDLNRRNSQFQRGCCVSAMGDDVGPRLGPAGTTQRIAESPRREAASEESISSMISDALKVPSFCTTSSQGVPQWLA